MRVLTIGSDRSLFTPDSAARERIRAYGKQFGELHIIVFSLKTHRLVPTKLDEHVHLYPTNSYSKFSYVHDAVAIGVGLEKPDVISVQDPFEAGLAGLRLSKRVQAPLHVQIHTDFLSPHFAQLSLLNRLRVYIAKRVLRHAARVRVVSQKIKESILLLHTHVHVTVLPIFVDVEHFAHAHHHVALEKRFSGFAKRVLFVGRLEEEKNPVFAIEAFIQAHVPDSCLILVGAGSQRNRLEKFVRTQKLEGRVFFEGQQDPAPYYKLADLYLCTSAYEGYGLSIVEALAAGVPVLSTDVGIAREVGAHVVRREHFAQALAEELTHPSKAPKPLLPYTNFDAYVRLYGEDIAATVR